MLPTSFGEANIQCRKKSATSALPLDHRSIALLNSDYSYLQRSFVSCAVGAVAYRSASSSWLCSTAVDPYSSCLLLKSFGQGIRNVSTSVSTFGVGLAWLLQRYQGLVVSVSKQKAAHRLCGNVWLLETCVATECHSVRDQR